MKHFFIVFGLLLAGAFSQGAHAQQADADISQEQELVQQFGNESAAGQVLGAGPTNQAVLLQLGNGNDGSIDQRHQGNAARIMQLGNQNTAAILQVGHDNLTRITQDGNRNAASSEIHGSGTESVIVQEGNNNHVDQRLDVNGREYSVEQIGNNNRLEQRESGAAAPPGYEVRMVGNGIRISIEQGNVVHP